MARNHKQPSAKLSSFGDGYRDSAGLVSVLLGCPTFIRRNPEPEEGGSMQAGQGQRGGGMEHPYTRSRVAVIILEATLPVGGRSDKRATRRAVGTRIIAPLSETVVIIYSTVTD